MANESGLNFISVKGPELLNMVSVDHYTLTFTILTEFFVQLEAIES